MTVRRFDTSRYIAIHGKEPRGFGQWWFTVPGVAEPLVSPVMSYSKAKAWAARVMPRASVFLVMG